MKRSIANLSAKRIAVDKTNASLIAILSISVFVTIFSVVSIKNLYSQMRYQSKVISAKEETLKQIEQNITEAGKLDTSYKEFTGMTENLIGGNPNGDGDRDGQNPKLVLDALPSKYDFPALATSMAKLTKLGGFSLSNIKGVDDEIAQSENTFAVSPVVSEMQFGVEVNTSANKGKELLELFEKSIRPISFEKIVITTGDSGLKFDIDAKTYYQPEKRLNVTEEVVQR